MKGSARLLACPTKMVSTMESSGSAARASTAGTARAKMAESCLLERKRVPMSAVQSASRTGARVVKSHRLHRVLASCWQRCALPGGHVSPSGPAAAARTSMEPVADAAAAGRVWGCGCCLKGVHAFSTA